MEKAALQGFHPSVGAKHVFRLQKAFNDLGISIFVKDHASKIHDYANTVLYATEDVTSYLCYFHLEKWQLNDKRESLTLFIQLVLDMACT